MSARLRVGLIGAGSMGSLHARVIHESDQCELVWVSDPQISNAERVCGRHGGASLREPDLSSVDAVVVAAPTEHHHGIATAVLTSGLPLLLEKPVADELEQTRALLALSESQDVPMMCGLLERFNPAVRTAFSIASDPVHVAATRHSPYVDRIRTGVASDLLIHDIDLVIRLFGEEPHSVRAVFSHAHPKSAEWSEDAAAVVLELPTGRTGEASASRLSQRKVRTMSIYELDRLIEIDLVRQDITIHRHLGLDVAEVDGLGYRQQSVIEIPVVRFQGEPLALQLEHFVDIVEGRADAGDERRSIIAPHVAVDAARRSARSSTLGSI